MLMFKRNKLAINLHPNFRTMWERFWNMLRINRFGLKVKNFCIRRI